MRFEFIVDEEKLEQSWQRLASLVQNMVAEKYTELGVSPESIDQYNKIMAIITPLIKQIEKPSAGLLQEFKCLVQQNDKVVQLLKNISSDFKECSHLQGDQLSTPIYKIRMQYQKSLIEQRSTDLLLKDFKTNLQAYDTLISSVKQEGDKLLPISSQTYLRLAELNRIYEKASTDFAKGYQTQMYRKLAADKTNEELKAGLDKLVVFLPDLKDADIKEVYQLLQWVAEGEESKAEAMLYKDKRLLLLKGEVQDLAGRTFKEITAFQYALWALDWRMWKMILRFLPKEQAFQQLTELEIKGTEHGKHYDFERIIGALGKCIFYMNSKNAYDAGTHWRGQVGAAQYDFPAHVINEYCGQRSFHHPQFNEEKIYRTRNFEGLDWHAERHIEGSSGKMGNCVYGFAISKGLSFRACHSIEFFPERYKGAPVFWSPTIEEVVTQRNAVRLLSTTRMEQFKHLKYELSGKPRLASQPIIFQNKPGQQRRSAKRETSTCTCSIS